MSFSLCLAVFVGGGMGALARFALSRVSTSLAASFPSLPPFPWMTLTANILGAILIGIVVGAAWDQGPWGPLRAAVLKTGFCGGLTTFSTFSLESLSLLESGRYGIATIYIASSLILSIAGVCLGRSLFWLGCGGTRPPTPPEKCEKPCGIAAWIFALLMRMARLEDSHRCSPFVGLSFLGLEVPVRGRPTSR